MAQVTACQESSFDYILKSLCALSRLKTLAGADFGATLQNRFNDTQDPNHGGQSLKSKLSELSNIHLRKPGNVTKTREIH